MRKGHGGNWIPISKAFLKNLPKDRPYTELEAAYSLQVDYDQENRVTVTGYANLWRWSKGKVIRFFDRMNVKITYPESTEKKRNQNGLITVHKPDLNRTKNRLMRLIDNKGLEEGTDLKQTKDGLKTDQSQVTTKETNTETDTKGNTFSENSTEFSLSKLLLDQILLRNSEFKKPNLQNWAVHVDRAMRLDKRTPDKLEAVILWCQQDSFWQNNILSTKKLRDQFDQLWLKMNNPQVKKTKGDLMEVNGKVISKTHYHNLKSFKQAAKNMGIENER